MVVVVDFALVRTSADTGVKPHPCKEVRNTAPSAKGISSGTFDFEDFLRAVRVKALRVGAGGCVSKAIVARLTRELSDVADPASM
jgi:hypothetical protein